MCSRLAVGNREAGQEDRGREREQRSYEIMCEFLLLKAIAMIVKIKTNNKSPERWTVSDAHPHPHPHTHGIRWMYHAMLLPQFHSPWLQYTGPSVSTKDASESAVRSTLAESRNKHEFPHAMAAAKANIYRYGCVYFAGCCLRCRSGHVCVACFAISYRFGRLLLLQLVY